jgi:hypothetical protein
MTDDDVPDQLPGSTGDDRVDAAVDRLTDLDNTPVDDHVGIYDDIHARLGAALANAAEPAEPPAGSRGDDDRPADQGG